MRPENQRVDKSRVPIDYQNRKNRCKKRDVFFYCDPFHIVLCIMCIHIVLFIPLHEITSLLARNILIRID